MACASRSWEDSAESTAIRLSAPCGWPNIFLAERFYHLVNIQKAIENGHRNSWFAHKQWWCSIVMFVYQRVHRMTIGLRWSKHPSFFAVTVMPSHADPLQFWSCRILSDQGWHGLPCSCGEWQPLDFELATGWGGWGPVISTSSRDPGHRHFIPGVPPSRFTMPAGEAQDMATSGTWLGWSPDGDGSWWGQDTRWEPWGTNDQQGYWRQLRSVEWSYLNHGMIGPQLSRDIKWYKQNITSDTCLFDPKVFRSYQYLRIGFWEHET